MIPVVHAGRRVCGSRGRPADVSGSSLVSNAGRSKGGGGSSTDCDQRQRRSTRHVHTCIPCSLPLASHLVQEGTSDPHQAIRISENSELRRGGKNATEKSKMRNADRQGQRPRQGQIP